MSEIRGDLDGAGIRLGVVAAEWNSNITDSLLEGALSRCQSIGVTDVVVLRVPGALEVPLGAQALLSRGCHGVVAIGAVIRGETDHYEIVVRESAAGLTRVSLDSGAPVANVILAVDDVALAMARAGKGAGNRGREGVDAAITMIKSMNKLATDDLG